MLQNYQRFIQDLALEMQRISQENAKPEEVATVSPAVEMRRNLESFYTVAEVAQSLGVSRPTVYRLINNGVLPITKIGSCTRISAEALEKAVYQGLTKKYRRA